MIRGATQTCASCRNFPLAASMPDGLALCATYGKQEAFSNTACVLHEPASDRAQRRALVARLVVK